MSLLKISDLHVSVDGVSILRGLDLSIACGEVHVIMGPNGSGKSTLAHVLAGHPSYQIDSGTIFYDDKDIMALAPEERAREGVFLAFQYPLEIEGVTNMTFLKAAFEAQRTAQGRSVLDAAAFLRRVRACAEGLGISDEMLRRPLNVGFSGGEKKRNEILQMALFEPKLAILDETDSGLDIDALRIVAEGVNAVRTPERAVLLITHYQRILDYIKPDFVHVLVRGRMVASAGAELAQHLEKHGYADYVDNDTPDTRPNFEAEVADG